jgi:hypothetical protein
MDEWDKLNKSITRHFIVTKYNYGEMIREVQEKASQVFDKLEELFDEEED